MPKKKEPDINGYYVIKFEKYIDMINEVESKYHIICDHLHDEVLKTLPDYWDDTPIPELTGIFSCVHEVRFFLDEKINNPPEEEIKLANKNNIKDVLIKAEELQRLNVLLLALQEFEADLEINYKISLVTH